MWIICSGTFDALTCLIVVASGYVKVLCVNSFKRPGYLIFLLNRELIKTMSKMRVRRRCWWQEQDNLNPHP